MATRRSVLATQQAGTVIDIVGWIMALALIAAVIDCSIGRR